MVRHLVTFGVESHIEIQLYFVCEMEMVYLIQIYIQLPAYPLVQRNVLLQPICLCLQRIDRQFYPHASYHTPSGARSYLWSCKGR